MSPTDFSHGVHYTPANIARSKVIPVHDLESFGITYIRLQSVDLINNVRYRVIPITYFKKLLSSARPGITVAKAALGLVYLNMAEGFSAIGEYLYVADLDTLRICPHEEGHATVMGYFQEKAPIAGSKVDVDICPRSILRRIEEWINREAASHSIQFLVGIEHEFILLKETSPVPIASNIHNWSRSEALRTGSVESKIMREISDALLGAGVEVQMYLPEAAPGQYEVVTGPLTPLACADAAIFTRETISDIAAKHGLRATFAPRVYMDSCGSSSHVHLSVHSTSSSSEAASPGRLTATEESFLSTLLEHLPSITHLTLPIPASYKRVQDGAWSGGTYVCWGTENREAPIRFTNAHSRTSRNFEMRFVDGTSSPYLALAAIIGAGLEGIKTKAKLMLGDCSYLPSKPDVLNTVSAAQMNEEDRKKLGITKRLPLSWEEARDKFKSDPMMVKLFGEEFVEKYLSVNKVLAEALAQDKDEAAELTRLVEFY
ncbi:glutamine synthetase/guanido kinase [Dendrothele bispora CBS 962.96]|uniref:Glutamine synthetase/guanido kinase n=1 Tax=Dendrothele bispora (strain CBS 962.96) TaxID=1314807 RepID=A0A4S8M972_DENBC|nr:glutamine synthetase/guanido kinase [Dendrothele bispora CBS 962.96]